MKTSRLSLALDSAGPLPPEGRIAVFGPAALADLSGLPQGRVQIIQGFRPDHDAWAARGYDVVAQAAGDYAAAVIVLPRAKAQARAWVAQAAAMVAPGGPIWIDGQKTDGADAMLRDLRARTAVADPLSKAHGKAYVMANPGADVFADWVAGFTEVAPGFVTLPGVFSADGVDRGSAVLAGFLPAKLPARMADLGAGWGWLAAQVLGHDSVVSLDLIEADHASLTCARANVTDPRAAFHWADATVFRPERRYQGIVTNPPFHTGRAGDPALGQAFIRAAADMLTPEGTLWLVANRHLPYEKALSEQFREVAELGGDGGFKVLCAQRPILKRAVAMRTRR